MKPFHELPVEDGVSLDVDAPTFHQDLQMAADLVVKLHEDFGRARLTPDKSRAEIAALFDEPLPETAMPMAAILREVDEKIFANSTLCSSPRFFAYINGSGNQAAIIAELLAASVNQICAKWHFSPAATEVERRVIQWIADFIGYPLDADGCLLSGGSAANLVALAMARKRHAPFDPDVAGLRGAPPLTVYVSREGHASIDKAMALLGLGRNQLRRIDVHRDLTLDVDALAERVAIDRANGCHPICVVANAGTTNSGAVDPLDELADFCREHQLWLHVDGAYGAPAARTAAAARLFIGLERADSVAVNPHKWLFAPVEASCILVRRPGALADAFRISADYLGSGEAPAEQAIDFKDYGPQLSRSFRALKVWMTFKAYGAMRLRAAIDSNISIMRYLAQRIDESIDFALLAPVPLSVVCFQYRTADAARHGDEAYLDTLNDELAARIQRDGRVFLTATKIRGRTALRACSINHRLQRHDVEVLLDVIRDVASRM